MATDAKKVIVNKKDFVTTVGRRKEAVARIRLTKGNGPVTVNGKSAEVYFSSLLEKGNIMKPFEVTQTLGKYGVSVLVRGGGVQAQLDAVIHGIARALSQEDTENYRGVLKTAGILTRDARAKERRKYGLAHAARAKKQSPKR